MRLFNPVTRAVADLPGVFDLEIISQLNHAAGVVYDGEAVADPTVVLSMRAADGTVVMYAKPGDAMWRLVALQVQDEDGMALCDVGLSVRGRFYIPTCKGDVLKLELQPQPHLVYAARQEARQRCVPMGARSYLVPSFDLDDADNGMLLVRSFENLAGERDMFRVNLAGEGSLTTMQKEGIVNRNIFLPWLRLGSD
jgi:hypothetical protein